MEKIERLWPVAWLGGAGGLAALGYAHLVLPIYLPVLLLLAIMASIGTGD